MRSPSECGPTGADVSARLCLRVPNEGTPHAFSMKTVICFPGRLCKVELVCGQLNAKATCLPSVCIMFNGLKLPSPWVGALDWALFEHHRGSISKSYLLMHVL